MKKRVLCLFLAAVMTLSFVACGSSSSSTPTGSSDAESSSVAEETSNLSDLAVLSNATYVNPNAGAGMYPGTSGANSISVECSTMSVMNTTLMTYATEFAIARHTYDTLVKQDAENNIAPAAAESWTSSEDGMKWTFNLRKDMKWVDSTGAVVGDVTAHDFVFAWSELLNPENAAEYYAFAAIFKNAQAYYDYASGVEGAKEVTLEEVGFKAVDDYTIELELEVYLPYLLQYLKFEVMSPIYESFYNEVGADKYATSPETALYCGPYYMTKWVTENTITLTRNSEWWDADSVSVETMNFVKFTDANAKYNAFLGGEIDIIDINGEQRKMFEAEGFNVSNFIGGYSFYFYCNNLTEDRMADYPNAKLSDARNANLRRAISAAIDREQIISTVFKNDNVPSECFSLGITGVNTATFGEAVVAANGGKPLYNPTSNVDDAKAYLALALEELGYSDVSEVKIALLTSEGTANEQFSQVVQEQLRTTLGLEVAIDVVTITEARARRNAKNYDLFMGGWGPDYNDPMTDLELFTSTNGNNHSAYASEAYDALIESTKYETDPTAREKLFIDAEFMLAEDMPIIPVYWRAEDYVVSEKLASGYMRAPFVFYYLPYTTLA